MRLWTVHPAHLDARGLVALWREGLLALAVLRGKTRGYRSHPQLIRFKEHPRPTSAIVCYLHAVCDEAERRGYAFDRSKLGARRRAAPIAETRGQLRYEWEHLRAKLRRRSPREYRAFLLARPRCHPSFRLVRGDVRAWEKRDALAPAAKPA